MLVLEKSKSGLYTAKCEGKYIHSKYDPLKESNTFVKNYYELLKHNIIVVYGLGLGYHIKNIYDNVTKDTIIYVFEWNKEIVEACKKINLSLFNTENIKIYTNNSDFYNILSKKLNRVSDIMIHNPSLETIKNTNYELYSLIKNYALSKISIQEHSELLNENFEVNKKVEYKKIECIISEFKNYDKPYVIAAAGPSLDYDLQMLKKNRKKFIIIAVGSALMTLMRFGIKPDIITIIDGKKWIHNQLKDYLNEDIPLCFLSTASRWAVSAYKGPKYMFFNSKENDNVVINTGKTVAVASINIAIACKAKEILLLGQDLAYIDGKSHSYTYEKMYKLKDNPTINQRSKVVKGVNGEILKTKSSFIYYKEQIEKIISRNKQVAFINCSKGAFIEGAKHMNLYDYLCVK